MSASYPRVDEDGVVGKLIGETEGLQGRRKTRARRFDHVQRDETEIVDPSQVCVHVETSRRGWPAIIEAVPGFEHVPHSPPTGIIWGQDISGRSHAHPFILG